MGLEHIFGGRDRHNELSPAEKGVADLDLYLQTHPANVRKIGDDNESRTYQEIMAWHDDDIVYLPVANLDKIPLSTTPRAVTWSAAGWSCLKTLTRTSLTTTCRALGPSPTNRIRLQIRSGISDETREQSTEAGRCGDVVVISCCARMSVFTLSRHYQR